MAIKLSDKPNTHPIDGTYPYGDIKDNTGSADGTPVNRLVYADLHQFFEKLMDEAGVTHNGLPENETNGFQLFEALGKLFVSQPNTQRLGQIVLEIGDWNMLPNTLDGLSKSVPHGLDDSKIRSVYVLIRDDSNVLFYPITYANSTNGDVAGEYRLGLVAGNVALFRAPGGLFQSSNYDSTSYNRGWITITHEL